MASPTPARPSRLGKIALLGNSDAYVTSSCGRVDITDSPEIADDSHWFPAMTIPQVLTPDQRTGEAQVQGVFPCLALELAEFEAIEAGRKFIHFRGFAKYNDVFGTERWTRSRRVWRCRKCALPMAAARAIGAAAAARKTTRRRRGEK